MRCARRTALLPVVALVPAAGAAQSTLVVPTAFPTIQAAIVAATPGGTVLVLPGTYVERIDFLGKAITVRSFAGAAATVIDGNQLGPVATFVSGEGPSSVLDGFTIRNGRGGTLSGVGPSQGGGVHCIGASPTIRRCVVTANHGGVGFASFLWPGGIGGPGGVLALDSALRLHDCVVQGNFGGTGGQAVGVTSALTATGGAGGTGGLWLTTVYMAPQPELLRCRIEGNAGGDGGFASNGSAYATGGAGGAGGIEMGAAGTVVVDRCTIVGNDGGNASAASGAGGGGNANGGHGGFVCRAASPPGAFRLRCCVIAGNHGGGAVMQGFGGHGAGAVQSVSSFEMSSCTVAGNLRGGPTAVAGIDLFSTGGALRNCILWGNVPLDLRVTSTFAVERCDVGTSTGTLVGTGNVSVDPLFVNLAANDVHLTAASPCRHAGGPANDPPFDVDGDPRVVGPAPDMGADEWDGLVGTREDFALELRVNGAFAPAVVTSPASAGDAVAVRVWSPSGSLANAFAVVGFEPWLPPASPVGPLPGIHLGGGAIVLGTFAGVGTNGVTFGTTMPAGLIGLALRVQAFALTASAANGAFAATAARDVLLQ